MVRQQDRQKKKTSNLILCLKGSHVQEMESQLVQVSCILRLLAFLAFLLYKVIMAGYIGSTIQYQMVVDPTPMYGLMSQVIRLQNYSQLPD
jgi:uncharacterized membrane protein